MFRSSKRCGTARDTSGKSAVQRAVFNIETMETRTLLSTVIYTVQTNSDAVPESVIPSSSFAYTANTLRAAVDSANAQSFPVVIQFNAAKFTGGAANTITLNSGLTLGPVMSAAAHSYKFVGPTGKPITISGANTYTDFTVPAGISAEFDNLTIAHGTGTLGGGIYSAGQLTLVGDTFASDVATTGGGGVYTANGLIAVTHTTFTSDSAPDGGGIDVQDVYPNANPTFTSDTFNGDTATANGGAIYDELNAGGISTTFVVSGSAFTGDTAEGEGGAIYNHDDVSDEIASSITNTSFTSDSAVGDGGAVYSADGKSMTLNTDTFTNNKSISNFGGAVYDEDYSLSIVSSTLTGNSAFDSGGAAYFESDGSTGTAILTVTNSKFISNKSLDDDAGALFNENSDTVATITGSSFTNNSAFSSGGAIYSQGSAGSLTLTNDTISNNSSIDQGGGVYSGDAALTVTGSTFATDMSVHEAGGGIYQTGATSVTVTNSSFTGDSSFLEGGALHLDDDSAVISITNGKFSNDSTIDTEDGGAIYSESTSLTVTGSSFTNNYGSEEGGGIYNDSGTLTVTNSTFTDNTAPGGGGAVSDDSADTTTITGSTFTNNMVLEDTSNGGAIESNAATLLLTGDTFTNNSASQFGGALYFDGITLQGEQLTFAGNSALQNGGAIYDDGVTSNVSNVFDSTFNGNSTSIGDGGAVFEESATINYANDTFNGNTAETFGGGIYIDTTGTATITDSTISGNSASYAGGGGIYSEAGDVILDGTIVAGNYVNGTPSTQTDLAGANGFDVASTENIIGDGLNAVGFSYGNVGGNFVGTDFMPIDPLLGALAKNGGPTETMKPAPTSLAIGTSSNFIVDDLLSNDVTAFDQRGVLRPMSQGYDIGAYQYIPPVTPDHFVFALVPGSVTTGQTFNAEVKIVTPGGSLDDGFIDSVTLSTTDGAGILTPTSLDFINGIATFSATLKTLGQQKLKVTDTSVGSLVSAVSSASIAVNAPAKTLPVVHLGTPATVHVPTTGTTTVKVPVILSATATSAITLTYTTLPGTASFANGDYIGVLNGKITIPAGSKAGTYYITISGVKHVTGNGSYPKTFQVSVTAATNATVLNGVQDATVTLAYP